MKTIECIKLARKANWSMLAAKRAGNMMTASFCRELRQINMMHAAQAWIAGR